MYVAPYVGAWIETVVVILIIMMKMSHPMWVRGLKHKAYFETYYPKRSHPMWVRGLKQQKIRKAQNNVRRTLCGCVD